MKNIVCYIFVASLFLCSCGDTKTTETPTTSTVNVVDSVQTALNDHTDFKFQMVVANIPSPFEGIDGLAKSGLELKKDLPNKPENVSKYLTTMKKALNYGVYGVDLAYLATNKEYALAPKYLEAAHSLAVSLDAAEGFDKVVGSRLEGHWENKDTVTRVMDEAFAATDRYLRTSERQLAASQILTGSWVESQYISLSVLEGQTKNAQNEILFNKMYEQKLHLANLTDLLKEYDKEKDFKPIIEKISKLNDEFKKISTVDDLTVQKIKMLTEQVGAIRDMIIK